MNNIIVAVCTPDTLRPSAKKLAASLKQTHLADTDLIFLDNGYEEGFQHAEAMNAVLEYADNQWVFFIDDDVLIQQPDWLNRMIGSAKHMNTEVIGCVHTHSSGEVNHCGAIVHDDGTTELTRIVPAEDCYVAALSSAVMGIHPDSRLRFDTRYDKYQHDLDLCLQAWEKGGKVGLCTDVKVTHEMAGYFSTLGSPAVAYARDAAVFAEKWRDFAAEKLYVNEDLSAYRDMAAAPNWEARYNKASASRNDDPKEAIALFTDVIAMCPFDHLVAGAHFHLYALKEARHHLEACLKINPRHLKARQLLEQSGA